MVVGSAGAKISPSGQLVSIRGLSAGLMQMRVVELQEEEQPLPGMGSDAQHVPVMRVSNGGTVKD